jgi:hypothetical protein
VSVISSECICGHTVSTHKFLVDCQVEGCRCLDYRMKPGTVEDTSVEHPEYYGGKDNPYEHVKVVNALGLNYQIGCATKYLFRAGKKPGVPAEQDLLKARKFIDLELERLKELPQKTMGDWALEQYAKTELRAPDTPETTKS